MTTPLSPGLSAGLRHCRVSLGDRERSGELSARLRCPCARCEHRADRYRCGGRSRRPPSHCRTCRHPRIPIPWHFSFIAADTMPAASCYKSRPRLRSGSGGSRSEEHTSELQSLMRISYAVFCLKKKNNHTLTEETFLQNTH